MLDAWIKSLSTLHSSLFTIRWTRRLCLGAAVILMAWQPSRAHTTGVSTSDIRIEGRTAQLRLRINLRDLDFVDQLDLDRDRLISREEVSRALPRHIPRLMENYRIQSATEAGRAELVYWRQGPGPGELEALVRYRFGGEIERLEFTVTLPSLTDSGHWNLARVRHPGGQADLNFNLENPTASLEVGRGWKLRAGRMVRGSGPGRQAGDRLSPADRIPAGVAVDRPQSGRRRSGDRGLFGRSGVDGPADGPGTDPASRVLSGVGHRSQPGLYRGREPAGEGDRQPLGHRRLFRDCCSEPTCPRDCSPEPCRFRPGGFWGGSWGFPAPWPWRRR